MFPKLVLLSEPAQEDMPVVYNLCFETLFLTFQVMNISKN